MPVFSCVPTFRLLRAETLRLQAAGDTTALASGFCSHTLCLQAAGDSSTVLFDKFFPWAKDYSLLLLRHAGTCQCAASGMYALRTNNRSAFPQRAQNNYNRRKRFAHVFHPRIPFHLFSSQINGSEKIFSSARPFHAGGKENSPHVRRMKPGRGEGFLNNLCPVTTIPRSRDGKNARHAAAAVPER